MKKRMFAHLALLATLASSPIAQGDGFVSLDFGGNTLDRPIYVQTAADGRIYVDVQLSAPVSHIDPIICGTFGLDANGTLLPAYGSRGRTTTCISHPFTLPDGSRLAFVPGASAYFTPAGLLPLMRFNPEGTPAGNFPVEPDPLSFENYRVIAPAPDGKLLIGGGQRWRHSSPGDRAFIVRRLNSDGSLDTSFAGGRLVMDISTVGGGPGIDEPNETVEFFHPLPDGKLLVSGFPGTVVRLTANGERDMSFGLNGEIHYDWASGIRAVDSLGRAYLYHQQLKRFIRISTADGSIDTGYQSPVLAAGVVITGVKLDSADRLVVFGQPEGLLGPRTGYIARYLSSGAFDTTFGGTGEVIVDPVGGKFYSGEVWCAGTLHTNDKPLIACSGPRGGDPGSRGAEMVLLRYNTDGTPDLTFGQIQEDTDVLPDPFTIAPKSAPYGTANIVSEPLTLTGFNTQVFLRREISIGCTGTYVHQETLWPGQTFCFRFPAPNTPLASVTYEFLAGERLVFYTVTSTNEAADVIPDSFSFPSRTNVPVGTEVFSDPVVISGITGRATVVIGGGGSSAYSLNCTGSVASVPGTIVNGQTICVRHYSAPENNASITSTLMIGGVSATFTSTTVAAPPSSPPPSSPPPSSPPPPAAAAQSSGSGGGGASDFLLLAPLGLIVAMSLTRSRRRARAS
jgi:uncharacterized delta-60 repeat protein